jgi:hypothetical protein
MKEVEPLASTLNWVFRVSRTNAMRRKLAKAHHPGNGRDVIRASSASAIAVAVTLATNR